MFSDVLNDFQEWWVDSADNTGDILLLENDSLISEDIAFKNNEVHSETLEAGIDQKAEGKATEGFFGEALIEASTNPISTSPVDWYRPVDQWDISEFDGLGSPDSSAQFWKQQSGENSCAVVAQTSIYESITGISISEEQACKIAQENGWFDPNTGTSPQNMGRLLSELGILTEQKYDARLEDIGNALERGDKVLVALDANEIWSPLRSPDGRPIEQMDGGHAVWVTGIDAQPDGSIRVLLNDSGTPSGKMKVVDAVDFMNAWRDFSNLLVVADVS